MITHFSLSGWHRDGQELRREFKNPKFLPRAVSTNFLKEGLMHCHRRADFKGISLAEGRLQHFSKGRKKEEENKDAELTGWHGKEEKEELDSLPGSIKNCSNTSTAFDSQHATTGKNAPRSEGEAS